MDSMELDLNLVGALEPWNFMISPRVGMMIQSDEVTHIFQRAR